MRNIKLFFIKSDYIDYLRRFDDKVPYNKNEKRPFVGIVLQIEDIKYYAPLTSPKKKHLHMKNTIDFRKIDNGRLGAINFNNMIPVLDDALINFSFKEIKDKKYRNLLNKQYEKLLEIDEKHFQNLAGLRKICFRDEGNLNNEQKKIRNRCCNLPLLESIYKEYKRRMP